MSHDTSKRVILIAAGMAIAATLAIIPACSDDEPNPSGPTPRGFLYDGPTIVMTYRNLGEIKTPGQNVSDHRCVDVLFDVCAHIGPDGIAPLDPYLFPETDSLTYPRKGLFEKLCAMNGDTAYVKTVAHYQELYHNPCLQTANIEDFTACEVTALSDYDPAHPKGSSLGDITHVSYLSLYPFVREGYIFNTTSTGNGPHPLYMEATPGDFRLMSSCVAPHADFNSFKEISFHCKATEIASDPIKMSSARLTLSLDRAPAQEAVIEVAVTVQMRGGEYPARTYTQTYKVR